MYFIDKSIHKGIRDFGGNQNLMKNHVCHQINKSHSKKTILTIEEHVYVDTRDIDKQIDI